MSNNYNRLPENVRLRLYNHVKDIYKEIFKDAPKYVYFQTEKREAPIFTIMQNKIGRIFVRHTYDGENLERPNIVYKVEEKYINEDDYMNCDIVLKNNVITLLSTKKYHRCVWAYFKNATFCYTYWLHKADYDVSKVSIPKKDDDYWLNLA